MPGKPSQLRRRVDAKRAARMRHLGFSNAQIAEHLGKPVERVPAIIELGQRYIAQDGESLTDGK